MFCRQIILILGKVKGQGRMTRSKVKVVGQGQMAKNYIVTCQAQCQGQCLARSGRY